MAHPCGGRQGGDVAVVADAFNGLLVGDGDEEPSRRRCASRSRIVRWGVPHLTHQG